MKRKIIWQKKKDCECSLNTPLFFYMLFNKNKRKEFTNGNTFLSNMLKIGYIFLIVGTLMIFLSYYNTEAKAVKTNLRQINSIKEALVLVGCRTVQTEEEHIKKGNGSMYAMDIACTRGQNFPVSTPLWKNTYIVDKISYDDRLGNYVILKHGEYSFVFAHTKINEGIKEGTRIKSGQKFGIVDKSGMSTNYHLHFELWKNGYNVSYKEMLFSFNNKTIYNTEFTYKLKRQRGWYVGLNKAMDFIADFEGFSRCAYKDGPNSRYSNGYGTKALSSYECISKEEARERKKVFVENVLEKIYKTHTELKWDNQRIALTSMLYNRGENSSIYKFIYMNEKEGRKWVERFTKNNTNSKYIKGILKRRNLELDLFYNIHYQ